MPNLNILADEDYHLLAENISMYFKRKYPKLYDYQLTNQLRYFDGKLFFLFRKSDSTNHIHSLLWVS